MEDTQLSAEAILEGLVVRIDHVGMCVSDIDEAGDPWTRLLGTAVVDREHVASQNVHVGWLRVPGQDTKLEFISPDGNAGLDKFLARRGNAIHHVAIAVSDIHEAVRRIDSAGWPLIDKEPRVGALGHLVAFLHPKAMAGTLVELVQAGEH